MFGISKDKIFKEKFEDITNSMVSLAFEYVKNDNINVNAIYVFCSNEEDYIYFNAFFDIDGKLLKKHKINDTGRNYDVSDTMQINFSKYGTEDLRKLINTYKKYKREPPTQIKMEYYPKTGKFDCNLDYELHYSNKKDKTSHDVAELWFNELTVKIACP